MADAILTCPNCDRSWSTIGCIPRETILCTCGSGLVVPDARSKAVAAASSASEAATELLTFARKGNQLGDTAFSVSVAEKLADAFRLAIEAQGGPDDADEQTMLSAIAAYLHPVRPPLPVHYPNPLLEPLRRALVAAENIMDQLEAHQDTTQEHLEPEDQAVVDAAKVDLIFAANAHRAAAQKEAEAND